jgi:hypothetical protein
MRRSPTDSEAALWRLLKGRKLGVSFKRQVPLLGYIVDFYASEVRLIVAVDGGYHAERIASMPIGSGAWSSRGIASCGSPVKWRCGSQSSLLECVRLHIRV